MRVNIFMLLTVLSWLMAVEPTILTDGLETVLPSFRKQWSLSVEGVVMDIEAPERSSFIYAVTEDESTYRLYKISNNGDQEWMQVWEKDQFDGEVSGLVTSISGNLICVHNARYEEGITNVFNGDGVRLYQGNKTFFPSPSGRYLIHQESNNFYPLELYSPDGKLIPIVNQSFIKGNRHMHRFVKDDLLLIYDEEYQKGRSYLYLITVPDGELLWTHKFDHRIWLIDFNRRNCDYNEEYIVLQGTRRPSDVSLFDYNGNLVWSLKGFFSNHAVSFVQGGQKIIAVEKGNTIVIIDVNTGEIISRQKIEYGGLIGLPKFELIEKRLFITRSFAFGKVEKTVGTKRFSHIVDYSTDNKISMDLIIPGVLTVRNESIKKQTTIYTYVLNEDKISSYLEVSNE